MSAPSPIKAAWLKEPKFVYELMHNGWSKGVENMRNRFYCQLQFDRTVAPEEQEAYTNLIHAAPELLEALRQSMVVDWDHRNLERADYDERFAAQMQWEKSVTLFGEMRCAAIQKAEGGES